MWVKVCTCVTLLDSSSDPGNGLITWNYSFAVHMATSCTLDELKSELFKQEGQTFGPHLVLQHDTLVVSLLRARNLYWRDREREANLLRQPLHTDVLCVVHSWRCRSLYRHRQEGGASTRL